MYKNYPFPELKEKISSAQKIIIALPERPVFDQVAAGLAAGLSLSEIGKKIAVFCPSPMLVEFNRLVGVDKVTDKVAGTDLIITFNYPVEQIEKVSYNDDNSKPNVVVQPKTGAPALTEAAASFSYAGLGTDLLVTIGIKSLEGVKFGGRDSLPQEIVNLDIDTANTNFGKINLIDSEASCLSESILGLILGLNLPLNEDIAQNVLSGLWQATEGLKKESISADAYETVAICLRSGAVKPQETWQTKKIEKGLLKEEEKPLEKPPEKKNSPPADWFEPKIYKGSNLA